jgi:hypothetical protein
MILLIGLLLAGMFQPAAQDSAKASEEAPSPAKISPAIEMVANAYGGREALAAFPGFSARGKILSMSDGLGGTVEMKLLLDGSLRAEIQYPSRAEVRILSGALAWNGGRRKQSVSTHAMKDAILLQYHRLAAPFEIAASGPGDFIEEERTKEGWIRLRREWKPGLAMIYDIDPKTGFVRRTTGQSGEGSTGIELVTEMEDFRKVEAEHGAVLFPFRTLTLIGGEVVSKVTFDRIEQQSEFSPPTFLPEGSAAGDF